MKGRHGESSFFMYLSTKGRSRQLQVEPALKIIFQEVLIYVIQRRSS